jgi:hypothetical protein
MISATGNILVPSSLPDLAIHLRDFRTVQDDVLMEIKDGHSSADQLQKKRAWTFRHWG